MKKATRKSGVLYLARAAMTAALYVLLTGISGMVGLSSGAIQVRLSEALCILPLFFPEAVPGLYVGCVLGNILTSSAPWDVVFGSLATLIGAVLALPFRKVGHRLKWLATIPTLLSNAFIVPLILIKVYGEPRGYWFLVMTVGLGELISALILGSSLYYVLKRCKLEQLIK